MSNSVKKYVGNGKKVANYDLVNFSIEESKVKDSWYEYKGKRYLKMTMGANKDGANEYGQTHKIWIDEYKPNTDNSTGSAPRKEFAKAGDDLPF